MKIDALDKYLKKNCLTNSEIIFFSIATKAYNDICDS